MRKQFIAYLGLVKRNLLVYLRDRMTIFFSLLGAIIILILYFLFLKENYINNIKATITETDLINLISDKQIEGIVNTWLLAGILGTTCITVSLNSLGTLVNDRQYEIDYDYLASPVKPYVVVLAYFTSSFISTLFITTIIYGLGLIFMAISGTWFLTIGDILLTYLILFMGTFSSTVIMMIIVTFFKTNATIGAFSGIVTALAGFIIGAYLPISQFSKPMQNICNIFPGSHVASLFRNSLMSSTLDDINISLNGIDNGIFIKDISETFSLKLSTLFGEASTSSMWIYIVLSTLVLIGINILLYSFTSKRK